jgi:hypothetical protein
MLFFVESLSLSLSSLTITLLLCAPTDILLHFWFCFVTSLDICDCVPGFPFSWLSQWFFSFVVLFPYISGTLRPNREAITPFPVFNLGKGIISTIPFLRNCLHHECSNATHFILLWRMLKLLWPNHNFEPDLSSNDSSWLMSGMIPRPTPLVD